jgi:hypothetical protein
VWDGSRPENSFRQHSGTEDGTRRDQSSDETTGAGVDFIDLEKGLPQRSSAHFRCLAIQQQFLLS